MRQHRVAALVCVMVSITTTASVASLGAQAPAVFFACYVAATGTVYRIKAPGLPAACATKKTPDVEFSWTDGLDALRSTTAATGDLSGMYSGPTVARIQGNAVTAGTPSTGQVLAWDGTTTSWKATTPPTGVTAHSQLTGLGVGDDHPQYLLTNGARTTTGIALTGVTGSGSLPVSGAGIRLLWFPNKAAFRAGTIDGNQWDDANLGFASFAGGLNTSAEGQSAVAIGSNAHARANISVALGGDVFATGPTSVAMGGNVIASGQSSIALGNDVRSTSFASVAMGVGGTTASGIATIAAGNGAKASGDYSAGIGNNVNASGHSSTALGTLTTSSGQFSTALGIRASTNFKQGAFVYGDASTTNNGDAVLTAAADNEFAARAAGGFRFRTSADLSTGCDLAAGSGTFNCTSSRKLKTGFESIDNEDVLSTLRDLPVTRWSYIAEGTGVRHLGPFAEDFHAAFGLGRDDVSIGVLDIAGVGIAATKALEARTRVLVTENAELRRENAEIRARLTRLEAALDRR